MPGPRWASGLVFKNVLAHDAFLGVLKDFQNSSKILSCLGDLLPERWFGLGVQEGILEKWRFNDAGSAALTSAPWLKPGPWPPDLQFPRIRQRSGVAVAGSRPQLWLRQEPVPAPPICVIGHLFLQGALPDPPSQNSHASRASNFVRFQRVPEDRSWRGRGPMMLMMLAPCASIISTMGVSFLHWGMWGLPAHRQALRNSLFTLPALPAPRRSPNVDPNTKILIGLRKKINLILGNIQNPKH